MMKSAILNHQSANGQLPIQPICNLQSAIVND